MEHRQSMRIPANVELRLFKRGEPVANGRLRDLSREGLFLATHFGDVRPNEILEIEFPTSSEAASASTRTRAIVVYRDGDGLGMVLADDQQVRGLPQLYSWLRRRSCNRQAVKSKSPLEDSLKIRTNRR